MSLGTEVGLGPGDTVLWGPTSLYGKGHSIPHFSAHIYCGHTSKWIRILLGTEVGLSPGDVLDWDPVVPYGKGHSRSPAPTFGTTLLWHRRPCSNC